MTENAASQVTPTKEPEIEEESEEKSPEPETTDENKTIGGIDPDNPPVNWGTPDGPQVSVQNYYADTVFELVSMEVLEASKGYVKFIVVTKKGGVLVDPDRTIELQYEGGAWKVINEGY